MVGELDMQKKSRKALLPCKTCPWRTDNDARTIPGYDHKKAVG
jgi:hypothetical protein